MTRMTVIHPARTSLEEGGATTTHKEVMPR
jgi:hypothetical protein